MRLIDADALWMDVIHSMDYCDDILEIIERQPTIEERKKGKWEAFMAYGKTVRHRCSECLAVAARDDFGKEYLSDYCTVCGADMRGEEDELVYRKKHQTLSVLWKQPTSHSGEYRRNRHNFT